MTSGIAHKPTDELRGFIRGLSLCGIANSEIANKAEMSLETLLKHYKPELAAKDRAKAKVVSSLYQQAFKGNVTAQIFICKTQLGWRETDRLEHSGPNGGAIPITWPLPKTALDT